MRVDTAEFVLSATQRDQFPRDRRPEVAFVGRSNVGKSSLMNRLVGRRGLARVGRTPGRTRMVNYFLINHRFYFVDLPGYGYAKAPKSERRRWAELMAAYFGSVNGERLLVQLVDGKVGATELDLEAHAYFRSLGLEPLVVATKIDKVPRSRRLRSLEAIRRSLGLEGEGAVVPFSAVSGEGAGALWKGITMFLTQPEKVGLA